MADQDQIVGSVGLTQQWIETSTGKHARLMSAALMGQTTGNDEVLITATTGGAAYAQLRPSTASIGILGASTAVIGHVIADASTAKIGALQLSTEVIGHIIADASTAKIGALQASTESIGLVTALVSTAKIGALQASTEVIGLIGGNTAFVSVNLAPTTSGAYAANDLIGAQITINSAFRSTSVMTGILQSLTLADKSTMQASIDLVLFHTNTTGTTYTNDAALTLADGDIGKIIGSVPIMAGDYIAFADNCLATVRGVALPIQATTGTTLYAAAINRSTGPQYTSTGDLILTLGILQD